MAVLDDEVLVEEPERLLRRRRRQPDKERVEVLDHLTPHPVDRAVALVDDHHVERLDRDRRVVRHLDRPLRFDLRTGLLVDVLGQLLFAAQHRVEALHRRDHHPRCGVDPVRGEQLHVVEVGELAAIAGGGELLELAQRLPAQVRPVDEE